MAIRFFLLEEEHKGILLIMSFILGIILYFSFPFEPDIWWTGLAFIIVSLMTFFGFFKRRFRFLSMFLFFLIAGIFVSKLHTSFMDTKFLTESIEKAEVSGEVVFVEERLNSYRLVLENVIVNANEKQILLNKTRMWVSKKYVKNKIEPDFQDCADNLFLDKIAETRGPKKPSKKISTDTCVYLKPNPSVIKKGDFISGTAFSLNAPGTPFQEGGFFEARTLFFEGVEAVGRFSNVEVLKSNSFKLSALDRFRTLIKERISFLNPDEKGVIQALLIGDAHLITEPIERLYRTLGLTHILSVSGFHVGLITFFIYYLIRFLLTLLTLKSKLSVFFIRNISAVLSLIVSFCYVLLTGAEPPAVRAFIMTGFVLGCFLLNKNALSIRTIFVAAFLLLCYKPVLILSVGFQLSFIAVLTLSVLVQNMHAKMKSLLSKKPVLFFIAGLILLNILVTFVTLPFVAYHFHKVPFYGIIGNLLLSCLFSFFIMPLLLCSVLFIPFGLEEHFLLLAQYVLTFVHFIGEGISSISHPMMPIVSFSAWGLVCFSFGFVLTQVMKGNSKYVGVLLIIFSLFSFLTYPESDLKMARGGRLLAVRQSDGKWRLNESFRHRMISDNWLLSNGQLPEFYLDNHVFRPKFVEIKGVKIAFDPEDCLNAALTFELRKKDYSMCPNLYPREKLEKNGVLDIFVENGKVKIKDLSLIDIKRPWGKKYLIE